MKHTRYVAQDITIMVPQTSAQIIMQLKTQVGKFKVDMNGLVITRIRALNPKVYIINHQPLDQQIYNNESLVIRAKC